MASLLNNLGNNSESAEHPTVKDALRNIFATKDEEDNNQDVGIHDIQNSDKDNVEKFDYDKGEKNMEANDNNIDDSFGSSDKSDSNKIDFNIGSGGTYLSGSGDFNKK